MLGIPTRTQLAYKITSTFSFADKIREENGFFMYFTPSLSFL